MNRGWQWPPLNQIMMWSTLRANVNTNNMQTCRNDINKERNKWHHSGSLTESIQSIYLFNSLAFVRQFHVAVRSSTLALIVWSWAGKTYENQFGVVQPCCINSDQTSPTNTLILIGNSHTERKKQQRKNSKNKRKTPAQVQPYIQDAAWQNFL